MVHGSKDKSVPVSYSRKVLKIFKNAKKKLVIVKMVIIAYLHQNG